jgi:hypothetical protein
MHKQIEQDDAGLWFYLPSTRLYGFKTEKNASDFKLSTDAIVASFQNANPIFIKEQVNPMLIKNTEELENLLKHIYENALYIQ